MNIKDQVLSIEQVRELQELGFDFRKYSSACVIEAKDRNKYIVDRRLIGLHIGFMETEVIEYYETMTIGDIIEVLPQRITMNNRGYILKTLHKFNISYTNYSGRKLNAFNLSLETLNLIDALFETLKWCIINKHIAL